MPSTDPPHQLSCHCGSIRLRVDAVLEEVVDCNCSTCRRHGFLHWKVPSDAVTLESERVALSAYAWRDLGTHQFCPTCGAAILRNGYPDGLISLNARCIENVDVFELEIRRFDGRRELAPGIVP